jgi:tetraacyldisaccharide 4'-kinase
MKLALLAYSPFSRLACLAKDVMYARGVLRAAKAPLPAVSVGNISFGGTEKTPLVMELIAFLLRRGYRPALVSRGYRGAWEQSGGTLSDGKALFGTWAQGGDEPFMVARRFPEAGVFVGRDKLASCLKARDLGFTAVVLDDAFQHRRLARDLDIVLVSPAARRPLRENVAALGRAGIVLVRRNGGAAAKDRIRASFPGAAVFDYGVTPQALIDARMGEPAPAGALAGKRVFAFCGIAGPLRFLTVLRELGADVAGSLAFPDHYAYPRAALDRIAREFGASEAELLVTTEKDSVKLAPAGPPLDGLPLRYLRIGLDIEAGFTERVGAALREAGAATGGPA